MGGLLTLRDADPRDLPQLPSAVASVAQDEPGLIEYLSKPISELRTMHDRVLADNPLRDDTESPIEDINPQEWRVVTLEHDQPDGSRVIVERGVPVEEVEALNLTVGQTLDIAVPEFDVAGDFRVTVVSLCPVPVRGDGHLVTSRFIYENAEVWDLRLYGVEESLGTTATHPFWSEDRQQFIPASDLQTGEHLRLADDTTCRVESLTKRGERETVYNIEVDGEHVYYVGLNAVLVHNTCNIKKVGDRWYFRQLRPNTKTGQAHRWVRIKKAKRTGVQRHHKIPWNNSTYNHQNHPLVRQAEVSLKSEPVNLMDLGDHAGPHSSAYHIEIEDRMTEALDGVAGQGRDAAREALDEVMDGIEQDIASGILKPYANKDVYIP